MSTPCWAAIPPTVSPGTTVYRFVSVAGGGSGAGGAGVSAGAATAAGTEAGSTAAGSAAAVEGSSRGAETGGSAACSTGASAVVIAPAAEGAPGVVAAGAVNAATLTEATTTALAMPDHSLVFTGLRPGTRSTRGTSVSKFRRGVSEVFTVDWFIGGPSRVGPATGFVAMPSTGCRTEQRVMRFAVPACGRNPSAHDGRRPHTKNTVLRNEAASPTPALEDGAGNFVRP